MLKNYIIDSLIIMLTIFASYKKLQYAITKTLYKNTITFRINYAKIHYFSIQNFPAYRKIWKSFFRRCSQFSSQCRKLCDVNKNFDSQCQKNVGYPPCIPIFLILAAVHLLKIILCENFDLWYFFGSTDISNYQET